MEFFSTAATANGPREYEYVMGNTTGMAELAVFMGIAGGPEKPAEDLQVCS